MILTELQCKPGGNKYCKGLNHQSPVLGYTILYDFVCIISKSELSRNTAGNSSGMP